jgi:hypothetical protein
MDQDACDVFTCVDGGGGGGSDSGGGCATDECVTVTAPPPDPPSDPTDPDPPADPSDPSAGDPSGSGCPPNCGFTMRVTYNINAPSNSSGTCLGQALSGGRGAALALDVIGDVATAVLIANPASLTAVVVGTAASSLGVINGILNYSNGAGLLTTGATHTVNTAGTLTTAFEVGGFIRTGTSFSKAITGFGILGSAYSTLGDTSAAISAYTNCRNGKS